jgi:hypothetical protein
MALEATHSDDPVFECARGFIRSWCASFKHWPEATWYRDRRIAKLDRLREAMLLQERRARRVRPVRRRTKRTVRPRRRPR